MKNAFLFLALLAATTAYTWYSQNSSAPKATVEASSQPPAHENFAAAPDFTAQTVEGTVITLRAFQGKAVVLNFWATWCAPCVIEFPLMLQLARALPEEAVFVFVSSDENRAEIDRFLKKHGQSLPLPNVYIVWDENKRVTQDLYQTYKLPETYLIDSSGRVREKIIGADVDWAGAAMRENIRNIAKNSR